IPLLGVNVLQHVFAFITNDNKENTNNNDIKQVKKDDGNSVWIYKVAADRYISHDRFPKRQHAYNQHSNIDGGGYTIAIR
ncbi:hypothetical protein BGZ95_003023, partial [Linnemannia exigua]